MKCFPGDAVIKKLPANPRDTRDAGLCPGSGRPPGVQNSNLLQYSCLENSRDREAWQAIIHGVAKNRTWLSTHTQLIYIVVLISAVQQIDSDIYILFYILFTMVYPRILNIVSIHSVCNSLHLQTPNSQSISAPSPWQPQLWSICLWVCFCFVSTFNGHEFEQALGDGEGWGSLVCYSPWGHKELDTTEWLNKKIIYAIF